MSPCSLALVLEGKKKLSCNQRNSVSNYKKYCVFRFAKIQEPLLKRRDQLEKVKYIHQFVRDVEDEKLWIEERMPQATSPNFGNSLLSVQLLEKKNHVRSHRCFIFQKIENINILKKNNCFIKNSSFDWPYDIKRKMKMPFSKLSKGFLSGEN